MCMCRMKIHFGSKIWQAPLYGSFVNLAYLKNLFIEKTLQIFSRSSLQQIPIKLSQNKKYEIIVDGI
jgi:hypothetical protein